MTSTADGWMGGQTDRQTDGQMDRRAEILPRVLQDIVPFGSAAQKRWKQFSTAIMSDPEYAEPRMVVFI